MKESVQKLKTIRNVVMLGGIFLIFVLWLMAPDVFQNSRFVHVGNGAYGHKIGALLVLLMPFMGFLPGNTKEEFHTDNEEEKIQMECDWNIKEKRAQILYAICGDLVGVMVMILVYIVG